MQHFSCKFHLKSSKQSFKPINFTDMKLFRKFSFAVLLLIFFAACNNDDYSLEKYWIDIGTVENPEKESAFFINLDDGTRLWTAASNFVNYRPDDGQRIIANFTILSDKTAYDHDIKLNDVYEVLTKPIFQITPETEDSIGNDPIKVRNIWIGNEYLNIEFLYYGEYKTHFINLVPAEKEKPEEGNVYLEFRHNDNDDFKTWIYKGYVSFDIRSLKENSTLDKLILNIAVNDPSEENKVYKLEYSIKNEDDNQPQGAASAFNFSDTNAIVE